MGAKAFPRRETKKVSTKPKFCSFEGSVECGKAKRIRCPECRRLLEPSRHSCTGEFEMACCVWTTIRRHRRLK